MFFHRRAVWQQHHALCGHFLERMDFQGPNFLSRSGLLTLSRRNSEQFQVDPETRLPFNAIMTTLVINCLLALISIGSLTAYNVCILNQHNLSHLDQADDLRFTLGIPLRCHCSLLRIFSHCCWRNAKQTADNSRF